MEEPVFLEGKVTVITIVRKLYNPKYGDNRECVCGHTYDRHFDGVREILNRTPLSVQPKIELNEQKSFYDFTVEDFKISNIDNIKKLSNNLELAI